jgi:YD repeat-containing protein
VATPGLPQAVHEPGGKTIWMTCDQDHSRRLASFFAWLQRYRMPIRVGILGSLLLYLGLFLPRWLGHATTWSPPDIAAAFQLGIAITVLPVGWLATGRRTDGKETEAAPRVPFPVHIQALIGTVVVVWLFRLVGLAWLAMALWHFGAAWLAS